MVNDVSFSLVFVIAQKAPIIFVHNEMLDRNVVAGGLHGCRANVLLWGRLLLCAKDAAAVTTTTTTAATTTTS
jgi:hypothetical protein